MSAVRAGTGDDARAIAELLHAFNEEFGDPTPGPDVLAGRVAAMLARADVVALLAGEPPVGIALLFFRPSVWDEHGSVVVDELYVAPERRGQGLGTQLIERAFAVARERGAEWLELDTGESDVGARRFYERHGLTNVDGGDRLLYYFRRL